ncbi:MAG: hypothetical protein JW727_01075 [Candidatus Aenigmarchaeota archaeon]|nr:hypothetical protein [Candidatus Aenigmarchaeota archaeon]
MEEYEDYGDEMPRERSPAEGSERPGFRRRSYSRFGERRDDRFGRRPEGERGRGRPRFRDRDEGEGRDRFRERRSYRRQEEEEKMPPEVKRGKARGETTLARTVYRGR